MINNYLSNTKTLKSTKQSNKASIASEKNYTKWLAIILFVFAFLLYFNTLNHNYAYDDYSVITGNRLIVKGIKGIPEIIQNSYWYGMTGKNEAVYRPLPLVMFAFEWQLSHSKPALGHFINILLYALTAVFLFSFLKKLFASSTIMIPFIITVLWLVHPVHTEVVANIKSRDEILAFLFGILSFTFLLNFAKDNKISDLIIGGSCFFLSLLSKESAITLALIIPLTFVYFIPAAKSNIIKISLLIFLVVGIYLGLRNLILTSTFTSSGLAINNSLFATEDHLIRFFTATKILCTYLVKLIFPNTLSSDYSFNEIPLVSYSSPEALISLLIYAGLLTYSIVGIRKKDPVSFGILFYLVTISVVSNLFFLSGSTMAERFLYTPSLGFIIAFVFIIYKLFKIPTTRSSGFNTDFNTFYRNKYPVILLLLILGLCAFKTIGRNADWKDNYTLFSADIHNSPNSALLKVFYSKELMEVVKSGRIKASGKEAAYDDAINNLTAALSLDSSWGVFGAYTQLGLAYSAKGDAINASHWYKKSLEVKPDDAVALTNLGNAFFRLQEFDSAIVYLSKAVLANPADALALNNLGSAYGSKADYENAISCYKKAAALNPNNSESYRNMGVMYTRMKAYDDAIRCFKKAIEINPSDKTAIEYLNSVNAISGNHK